MEFPFGELVSLRRDSVVVSLLLSSMVMWMVVGATSEVSQMLFHHPIWKSHSCVSWTAILGQMAGASAPSRSARIKSLIETRCTWCIVSVSLDERRIGKFFTFSSLFQNGLTAPYEQAVADHNKRHSSEATSPKLAFLKDNIDVISSRKRSSQQHAASADDALSFASPFLLIPHHPS